MKGVRKHGVRIGNWLTIGQGQTLLHAFDRTTLRGKRGHAMVAVLLGCGLRRAELAAISVGDLQRREEHRVFADLIGKGGHVRTVPVPDWVGSAIQAWLTAAAVTAGPMFRAIKPSCAKRVQSKSDLVGRDYRLLPTAGRPVLRRMTCGALAPACAMTRAVRSSRSSTSSATKASRRLSDTSAASSASGTPSMIELG